MVNVVELRELIANGENSGVAFKEENLSSKGFAKDAVAFLNLRGGTILIGVSDDRKITGVTRPDMEEWVMNVCRDRVEPPTIPFYEELHPKEGRVAVVSFPPGPFKPYKLLAGRESEWYIRVGSTSRPCSREEMARLYQEGGFFNVAIQPVPGSSLSDLDMRRLRQYYAHVLDNPEPSSNEEWIESLALLEFVSRRDESAMATVGGVLLFGRQPRRLLPQSGIRLIIYKGSRPDYDVVRDEQLVGPMVGLFDSKLERTEDAGLAEQALGILDDTQVIPANITVSHGRRLKTGEPSLLAQALRELIVNALVHRDYTITGRDITLSIFSDRIEVSSPGRLPNTVTIEGLKQGIRYARNQLLINVMRDYGYVEHRGMGIRSKVIPAMRQYNGTEPEFMEGESEFTVVLSR